MAEKKPDAAAKTESQGPDAKATAKPAAATKAAAKDAPAKKAGAKKAAAKKAAKPKGPARKGAKDPLPPAIVPVARRGFLSWVGLGWASFAAANLVGLGLLQRFLFPNVLFEPPTRFTLGFPDEYTDGVHTKWKAGFGVWLVRTDSDMVHEKPGFFALSTTCTHLGCQPNWLAADLKFKCPCHGSGFRNSGVNFEGPAPRPLERYRIGLAEDGQIFVDKSKKFQQELGQWQDSEAFLAYG